MKSSSQWLMRIQHRVDVFVRNAFGAQSTSMKVRGLRLLEESIEYAQAVDVEHSVARNLVDYVYSRPAGSNGQELGGVGLTWLAACSSLGMNADDVLITEVERVESKPPEHFTKRNQVKCDAGFDGRRADSLDGVGTVDTDRVSAIAFVSDQPIPPNAMQCCFCGALVVGKKCESCGSVVLKVPDFVTAKSQQHELEPVAAIIARSPALGTYEAFRRAHCEVKRLVSSICTNDPTKELAEELTNAIQAVDAVLFMAEQVSMIEYAKENEVTR